MIIGADIQADEVIQIFAAMKDVDVSTVIHKAAKDFSKAAWQATPRARVKKSDYSMLLWDGKFHFIKISNFERLKPKRRYKMSKKRKLAKARKQKFEYHGYSYQLKRLLKHRVRIPVMWSQASWIGVFRALGMQGRTPPIGQNKNKVTEIGKVSNDSYIKAHSEVVITDDIRFTSPEWKTAEGLIARKGFEAAAKSITKELHRMVKELDRGTVTWPTKKNHRNKSS